MKRIVILCDGTWNTPDKFEGDKPCITNVVKIAEAVKTVGDDGIKQLTYYDPGIGTYGSIVKRWFDGATGTGISKNILEAYRYLIMNYETGDELYLLGFSRGAFTVRSLAGLINNSGILRPNAVSMTDDAYKLYKSRNPKAHPRSKESSLFRKTYALQDITPIKFIGVWDTVGSLGNPLLINSFFKFISLSIIANSFHDTDLSSTVSNAYQALALDEKRRNFKAAIWKRKTVPPGQKLEQKWFIGVHSNVGGGYPSCGLSDITLKWMIGKIKTCGLTLEEIKTEPDYMEGPDESWKGFYMLIPRLYRQIGKAENGNESIHESVIERYKNDPKYRPKNLEIVFPDRTDSIPEAG